MGTSNWPGRHLRRESRTWNEATILERMHTSLARVSGSNLPSALPVSARAEQSSTPINYKSWSSSITAARRACEPTGRRIALSSSAALTAPLDRTSAAQPRPYFIRACTCSRSHPREWASGRVSSFGSSATTSACCAAALP